MIAEFEQREFYGKTIDKFGGNTGNELPEMKYRLSWDWIMPVTLDVFDVCAQLPYGATETKYYEARNLKAEICIALLNVNPQMLWNAVVEFIQWYNQNKQS